MNATTKAGIACGLALAGAVLLGAWAPAAAHDDAATWTVEAADPAGDLTVHVEVSGRYSEDQELVEEADPAATATGPGGASIAPTPLTAVADSVGLYEADLTFPAAGAWTLTVTSTEPEGTVSSQIDAAAQETTTTTAAETTTTAAAAAPPADGDSSSDSGNGTAAALGIIAVIVIVVGVGFYAWLRSRRIIAADAAASAGETGGTDGS